MMKNYHIDVPLLKFFESVYRIKSNVEKTELVQFFEIADFLKDFFGKPMTSIHFSYTMLACLYFLRSLACVDSITAFVSLVALTIFLKSLGTMHLITL